MGGSIEKDRSLLELLTLLKEDILEFYNNKGMCGQILSLNTEASISDSEYNILCDYVGDHIPQPKHKYSCTYWWDRNDIKPRITWLDKHIKHLKTTSHEDNSK